MLHMDRNLSLSQAIKAVRKRLKWTQENLGKQAGCSRSLVASFESGTRPTEAVLQRLVDSLPEHERPALLNTVEAREVLGSQASGAGDLTGQSEEDMINIFMSLRRSADVDLSGAWNAMWLTTINGKENRNREIVHARRRFNGSWEFANEAVSEDNPEGGYLWIAKLELFDNTHILGYYCARDRSVLAKGTLCLALQPNGREIVGVWDGLNFDTMWATGAVALCRASEKAYDPEVALDRFIRTRPKMPY
jgi:transcriptional regulator with XRE-family HTH domain